MVAVVERFLGIHSTVAIGVLSSYGDQNNKDFKINKHGRVGKSYRVRISYSVQGRQYHNSSLHLGVNWAKHKDHVAVPFCFLFLLFPKQLPCTLRPP